MWHSQSEMTEILLFFTSFLWGLSNGLNLIKPLWDLGKGSCRLHHFAATLVVGNKGAEQCNLKLQQKLKPCISSCCVPSHSIPSALQGGRECNETSAQISSCKLPNQDCTNALLHLPTQPQWNCFSPATIGYQLTSGHVGSDCHVHLPPLSLGCLGMAQGCCGPQIPPRGALSLDCLPGATARAKPGPVILYTWLLFVFLKGIYRCTTWPAKGPNILSS